LVLVAAAVLQACGGGAAVKETAATDSPGSVTPPPASPTNHAPTISGTPPLQVQVGSTYSFTPQAADSDGDSLTFTIVNKPAWASFDTKTGALTGTASSSGTFSGVTIGVTDGNATASLAPFAIATSAAPGNTGSVSLSWSPPTSRTDGTALTNLAGYRIRYGTSPNTYTSSVTINTPGVASYVIDNLSSGTYYFVVVAVDAAGVESTDSNSASKTIS
jgi:hypothetical protein